MQQIGYTSFDTYLMFYFYPKKKLKKISLLEGSIMFSILKVIVISLHTIFNAFTLCLKLTTGTDYISKQISKKHLVTLFRNLINPLPNRLPIKTTKVNFLRQFDPNLRMIIYVNTELKLFRVRLPKSAL